ncbi:thioredoxin reductase-like selenoprotein T homolog CG3887 [Venturia canescens]|uniref:thioredoxin reductase-like selenoprotein T homolog CG3887 n=1 Tax=Venturia canescens TaxID=32260 RepID=UPI001C9CF8A1|nr:thioredoxin reductase-like selenoprotein T homolog CG3887 [Venturia canescens]
MLSLKLSISLFMLLCAVNTGAHTADDEMSLTKLGANSGPTLKFYYCYSCGYKRVFQDYVNILQQKYPELQIDGENYNPPGYNMWIAKFLGTAKIILIVLIITGVNILQFLGQPTPFWWQWCIDNRLYGCIMIFFLCNAIEGHLISSGAFEILFNDVPVWSKLETGRMPQPPELFQIIDNHIHMLYPDMKFKDITFNNK